MSGSISRCSSVRASLSPHAYRLTGAGLPRAAESFRSLPRPMAWRSDSPRWLPDPAVAVRLFQPPLRLWRRPQWPPRQRLAPRPPPPPCWAAGQGVGPKLVEPRHFVDPARVYPIGVIMRGVADFGEPDFAVERVLGNLFRLL